MFRKMLSLAVEAAKEEIRIWKNPTRMLEEHIEPELVVEVAPEQSVTASVRTPDLASWRHSNRGHVSALASKSCPDCGEPKNVGWYHCDACRPKKAAS